MASLSTNLLLSLFAQGDSNGNGFTDWGASANSNFTFLENALTELSSITVTNANVTLTAAEARSVYVRTSGVLTGNRDVLVPARKHLFVAYNGNTGAYTLTFKVSGQTGVVLAQGAFALFYCNGTDVTQLLSDAYIKTNVLGTVSQTSGVPTGPLFEHSEGTPSSGDYTDLIRFADGTQIVRGRKTLTKASDSRMDGTVTFAKNFVDVDYTGSGMFRPDVSGDPGFNYADDCNVSVRALLAPFCGTKLVGSAVFSSYAVTGASSNFNSGDKLYVDFKIVGRWF